MRSFIDHARTFPARADADGCRLAPLAAGQSPQALFVTCSDSRVVPSLICAARPGELFELRTAGNIIPDYDLDRPSGEAATIEFAARVLGVTDIVVCGHSHCGAVGALVRGDDLTAVPALARWLDTTLDSALETATGDADTGGPESGGAAAPPRNDADRGTGPDDDPLAAAVQRHVLTQIDRLRAYPAVRARLDDGTLTLHAWYYQVHTGTVLAHRPADGAFTPL